MTPLAAPAEQGGHHAHLAAALTAHVQHLEQQKRLHAALQADLGSIGKGTISNYFWCFGFINACMLAVSLSGSSP